MPPKDELLKPKTLEPPDLVVLSKEAVDVTWKNQEEQTVQSFSKLSVLSIALPDALSCLSSGAFTDVVPV